jgi:hypothetical protein
MVYRALVLKLFGTRMVCQNAGELRGFQWENYDGEQIRITQSVWRGHIGEPKTAKSSAPIPVIAL